MDKEIWNLKIENKKMTRQISIIVSSLFVMTLVIFFYSLLNSYNLIIKSILIVILIFSCWKFLKIKYFMLEFSGEVLTIRYHHPFRIKSKPMLEIPINKVVKCEVEKGFNSTFFKIKIINHQGKNILFYYHLQGFSEKQKHILKNLLFIYHISLSKPVVHFEKL